MPGRTHRVAAGSIVKIRFYSIPVRGMMEPANVVSDQGAKTEGNEGNHDKKQDSGTVENKQIAERRSEPDVGRHSARILGSPTGLKPRRCCEGDGGEHEEDRE